MRRLDFWFDFASTYSYLSAMRIEPLAAESGVAVQWHPFLLGPIFKAQGWTTSPFNLYPAKGRYMIRDIERIAAARGIVFHMPQVFPANSITAARIALVGAEEGWIAGFSKSLFKLQFAEAGSISDEAQIRRCLSLLSVDVDAVFERSRTPVIKERLRAETEAAGALGLFGAPSFVTADGEVFWGDDRLEMALAWKGRPPV